MRGCCTMTLCQALKARGNPQGALGNGGWGGIGSEGASLAWSTVTDGDGWCGCRCGAMRYGTVARCGVSRLTELLAVTEGWKLLGCDAGG